MRLSNETYDLLKWLAIYLLPGLATFIGVVGMSLGWEYTPQAVTVTTALGTFIATIIGMSKREYERALAEQEEGEDAGMD